MVYSRCPMADGRPAHTQLHCDLKVTQNSQTYKMQKKKKRNELLDLRENVRG